MRKCYKCAVEIKPYWKRCYNCKVLLLCPQCDNIVTGKWQFCPNCKIDLDFGRISKLRALGYNLGVGIFVPLMIIILGLIIFLQICTHSINSVFPNYFLVFRVPILSSLFGPYSILSLLLWEVWSV